MCPRETHRMSPRNRPACVCAEDGDEGAGGLAEHDGQTERKTARSHVMRRVQVPVTVA